MLSGLFSISHCHQTYADNHSIIKLSTLKKFLPSAVGFDMCTFLSCHSMDCHKSELSDFLFPSQYDGQGSYNKCSSHHRQTFNKVNMLVS